MSNATNEQGSRQRARGRLTGALRTPAGAGALVVVVVAAIIALGGLLGAAGRPSGSVAAASPSTSATAVTPTVSPPATATPTATEPPASQPATPTPEPGAATPDPGEATPSPGRDPTPSPTPDLSGVPAAVLQARLDKARERLGIPGVSVAILWDDGRRWLGASGLRDIRAGDPMTTGTAFALASVSKTFTAAVVLQLVEEGALGLDDRVAPLLPAYDLHPRITVRQLLDHTSGLPDYFLNGRIDRPLQSDKDATWTPAMTWEYVAPPNKRFRPGRVWYYSNSNYLLLGELVEAVTGRPLAKEVRDRLLDPLGLDSSWYQVAEKPAARGTVSYRFVAGPGGRVRVVPVARRSPVMPFRSVVTAAAGAGSVAGTAADAARWMQAYAGGEVLGPALQRAMLADLAVTRRLRPEVPYGLGIQAVPLAGRYALGHSGRFLGFRNVVRYLPAEGVTIAVLTNQGVEDPAKVAERLLKVVLPPLPRPVKPVPSGAPAASAAP